MYLPQVTIKDGIVTNTYITNIGGLKILLSGSLLDHGEHKSIAIDFQINNHYNYVETKHKYKIVKWLLGAYNHLIKIHQPRIVEGEVWQDDHTQLRIKAYEKLGFNIDTDLSIWMHL